MKKTISISLLLIILCAACLSAQVFCSKLTSIPDSYSSPDWKLTNEYTLTNAGGATTAEDMQTKIKIGYTKKDIVIAISANDPNISAIRSEAVTADTFSDTDDRIEIYLAPKTEPYNFYHFIVNGNGTYFDAAVNDRAFNANAAVKTDKTDTSWNTLINIDMSMFKSSKTNTPPADDDEWIIKIFRFSSRPDITSQSLNNLTASGTKWEKIYFGEGGEAFNRAKAKIISRLMELNQNKTSFPEDISNIITSNTEKINALLNKEGRNNVEESYKLLEECNKLVRYYIGAKSQLVQLNSPITLPFCATFSDSNKRLYLDKENLYPNYFNYSFGMAKGERKSFQFVLSAWKDASAITVSFDNPKLAKYTTIGTVDYIDISNSSYSKVYDSNYIQDPITNVTNKGSITLNNLKAGETKSIWFNIDMDAAAEAGVHKGNIKVNMGEITINFPMDITVWNFQIATDPDIAWPISDLGMTLGLYTGYINQTVSNGDITFSLNNPLSYYRAVSDMSRDMLSKRITNARINIGSMQPWIDMKQNQFGKWNCDMSILSNTLKCIFSTGIKTVNLSEYSFGLSDKNKYQVFARTLGKVLKDNGWENKVYITSYAYPGTMNIGEWTGYMEELKTNGIKTLVFVKDEKMANTAAPYADIIASNFPLKKTGILESKMLAAFCTDMTLESQLFDARRTAWDMYFNKQDKYIYYGHNNWSVLPNPFVGVESDSGLNSAFRIYPSPKINPKESEYLDTYSFSTISSMRMESTIDAITDMLYMKKLDETIDKLKKTYKTKDARDGELIIEQFQKNILTRPYGQITSSDYEKVKQQIGSFINLNQ